MDPARVLRVYPGIESPKVSALAGGWINRTFAVEDPSGTYVLQRLHDVWDDAIHENIAEVTAHLRARGLASPELLRTRTGALFARFDETGERWRLMTRVPGHSRARCESPAQARSAARLVARFHDALADFDRPLAPTGLALHDIPAQLGSLRTAVDAAADHRLAREVREVAARIFAIAEAWEPIGPVPSPVTHGDLKWSNVLFDDASGEATAIVDLDTLGRLPLYLELGDAWRSWCNLEAEDVCPARLDLDRLAASAEAYVEGRETPLEPSERASLVHGLERIALELASRFAADALRESYFGWDPERYPAAGEHHLARARAQLSLAEQARVAREACARALGL